MGVGNDTGGQPLDVDLWSSRHGSGLRMCLEIEKARPWLKDQVSSILASIINEFSHCLDGSAFD